MRVRWVRGAFETQNRWSKQKAGVRLVCKRTRKNRHTLQLWVHVLYTIPKRALQRHRAGGSDGIGGPKSDERRRWVRSNAVSPRGTSRSEPAGRVEGDLFIYVEGLARSQRVGDIVAGSGRQTNIEALRA